MNYQLKRTLATVVLPLLVLFCIVVAVDVEKTSTAIEIANSKGCEYIGSARDLSQVKFFDCNGKIEMVRVK